MTDCVPVRGIYGVYNRAEHQDAPAWGHLDFYPNTKVLIDTEGVVVNFPKKRVVLDRSGCFEADLFVTDDPFWRTQGWSWKVDQFICGKNIGTAYFQLPQGDGEPLAIIDRMTWDRTLYTSKYYNPPEALNYKGDLPSVDDLPTGAFTGDCYTVKGRMHVWEVFQWTDWGTITPGPPGPEGPRGPCGPEGPQGEKGEQGFQARIEVGDTTTVPYPGPATVTDRLPDDIHRSILDFELPIGPIGPPGKQGSQGPPGAGVNFLGELNDVADLPDPCDHQMGDAYFINNELWVLQTGDPCGSWVNAGQIQGPPGPPGDPGDPGDQSTVSVVGTNTLPPGSDAEVIDEAAADPHNLVLRFEIPEGKKGDTGDGAEVNVRDTVTLPPGSLASVSDQNSTPHIADLVFEIPAGETGPMGPGINWQSILPTYADLLAVTGMVPGDCYGVEEEGENYGLWVYFGTGGWFHANVQIDGLASEDFVKDYVKDYVDAALAPRYMEDYQALLDQADGNWTGGRTARGRDD